MGDYSEGSLPLIFCTHVRSGPIYRGTNYLAEKIIRYSIFSKKRCDDILHVILFHYSKTPYIICKFFTKFIYNEYIKPYILLHVVLRLSPMNPPREIIGKWFGRCIRTAFGHFLLGSHNFMVTALGSCVKWPQAAGSPGSIDHATLHN